MGFREVYLRSEILNLFRESWKSIRGKVVDRKNFMQRILKNLPAHPLVNLLKIRLLRNPKFLIKNQQRLEHFLVIVRDFQMFLRQLLAQAQSLHF